MSWIKSSLKGKCLGCGSPYSVGEAIWWERSTRGALCQRCKEAGYKLPLKSAGRGAKAIPPAEPFPAPPPPPPPNPDAPVTQEELRALFPWCDPAARPPERDESGVYRLEMDSSQFCRPPLPSAVNASQAIADIALQRSSAGIGTTCAEAYQLLAGYAPATKWSEMVDRLADQVSAIRVPSIRRLPCWDIDGSEASWERWYDGHEKVWRGMRRASGGPSRRIVRVLLQCAFRWNVKPDEVAWGGAVALAMTRALEQAGYRVELIGVVASRAAFEDGSGRIYRVRLKEADQPVDIGRLSSWVCCPATQRMMAWGWDSSVESRVAPNRGYALPVRGDEDDIVIDGVTSYETATNLVAHLMRRFGGEEAA